MVSLNEKRSKIRYVVQNKSEWSEDGNKFGKRMLEKMGWTSGGGLGKNEDGRTEHIDLKVKTNLKGVGFVHGKYDSTWIAHSQGFDSLLEQLQQSHPSTNKSSINDFNEHVQQTKTRFTYKKQSSGKDLSRRSNDELDCIFGWNKPVEQNNDVRSSSDNGDTGIGKEEETEESQSMSKNLYLTSKQSIDDYFKEKSKKKHQRAQQPPSSVQHATLADAEQASDADRVINQKNVQEMTPTLDNEPVKKKKKKKSDAANEEMDSSPQSAVGGVAQEIYVHSNLSTLSGYPGWQVETSVAQILKAKEKQRKRKHQQF